MSEIGNVYFNIIGCGDGLKRGK